MLDISFVSVLNGLAIGSLLFILAVGLTLIFGMMNVLNLAHGAVFLLGAYLGWLFLGETASWIGFLVALAVAGGAGLLAGGLLSLMTRPLARRSHLDQALLTLGIALIVAELLSIIFGNNVRSVSAPSGLDSSLPIGDASYPVYRMALIGIGLAVATAVYVIVERTSVGALVRATVADQEMVAASGIDTRRIKLSVFAVGSMLAAVAGVLGAPVYGASPGLDTTILILALIVVVIGGLGSVRGAMLSALVIGQVQSLGVALLADQASFILFGALALVLVFRPHGLFTPPVGAKH